MRGPAAGTLRRRLGRGRAALAILGTCVGSGGLYVAIWSALGFVLR